MMKRKKDPWDVSSITIRPTPADGGMSVIPRHVPTSDRRRTAAMQRAVRAAQVHEAGLRSAALRAWRRAANARHSMEWHYSWQRHLAKQESQP